MSFRRLPAAAQRAARRLPVPMGASEVQIRQAAWVARCVGRGQAAPLRPADVTALASTLEVRTFPPGSVLFRSGDQPPGVWIVRDGRIELSVGSGRRRAVVQLLRPGDVDGDIQLLLEMPLPYTGRALSEVTCLFLARQGYEDLLATHLAIARRWLSSVAQRLAASQARILALLGGSLATQASRLLAEEAVDGRVELPQRTLAAMLGVQRPSLNKVLKDMEHEGLIRISYSVIEVVDRAKLAARALHMPGDPGAVDRPTLVPPLGLLPNQLSRQGAAVAAWQIAERVPRWVTSHARTYPGRPAPPCVYHRLACNPLPATRALPA